MNNTSKYTITQEPAIYEGIEYSKIVYRDENGEIIQVCRLGFNPTSKISEHKTKLKTSA